MEERTAVVQRFYEAFCARDWDALRAVFSDDAELGFGGRNPFAGEYHGPDAVVGVFRELIERSGGTFAPVREETWDICTSDHHVLLFDWFAAERGDRTLRAYLYFVCALEDARIVRMFVHSSEQYEFDEFWQ